MSETTIDEVIEAWDAYQEDYQAMWTSYDALLSAPSGDVAAYTAYYEAFKRAEASRIIANTIEDQFWGSE